mgnify:CR=1 FL=1
MIKTVIQADKLKPQALNATHTKWIQSNCTTFEIN